MLFGRRQEISVLTGLLEGAESGRGAAVVVRGEAGIGKTALLEWALEASPEMRVLRATGVEFEMGLPFSGLHQLLAPLLNRLERLSAPQREAIEVAFGHREGVAPDRLMVGMATMSLLSEMASERPVLCVIDDAQWLDQVSAQALAFAARRIAAERVALLLGLRDPVRAPELDQLPSLRVSGLPDTDAHALLASVIHTPLDEQVRERVLSEARGNPLALVELTAGASPTALAGGYGLPLGEGGASEELFQRRLAELPAPTRRLLLIAAAEPLGDSLLLWEAARRLGIEVSAAAPAEDTELLQIDVRVRFRHPLVRSAVYRSASPMDRRAVHEALAEVTDAQSDPDRRAWHRAQAALGPDDDLAAELMRSAARARTRGGLAASAAFLERAAALTSEAGPRLDRVLSAAGTKLEAGAPHEASVLLGTVDETGLDPLRRARVELLRGQVAFAERRGADAPALLLQAARRLEPVEPRMARETYLDALFATVIVGSLGPGTDRAAQAALAAVPAPEPPNAVDLALDGLALAMTGDRRRGTPLLRRALAEGGEDVWGRRTQLAAVVAMEIWDLDLYTSILERHIERARVLGALTSLSQALSTLAAPYLRMGRFETAESLLEQAQELVMVTGTAPSYSHLTLAAWRGRRELDTLVETTVRDATARGEGMLVAFAHFALALHRNGYGDYGGALAAARYAASHLMFLFRGLALRELVEAAARANAPEIAAEAYAALRESTSASETDFGAGTEHCCAALVSSGREAEEHYLAALELLQRSGCLADLARARLLYGEWLRREGRRSDARKHLREAHASLSQMGAEGFAERAARELNATGERARKRNPSTFSELTPQELHIGRLASAGATSKEISAELFLSPRTVDAHLRNVFRKLGITSRRQLRGTLPQDR
ncbi:helix-turn-helix transcriptional regulator [Nonomuraea polychroma]|uniref:helix-turn-helix transcriptional regulator n=1 Tax=Nonomuraea polychroma TaxID=46176 RepID=UPI003D8FA061